MTDFSVKTVVLLTSAQSFQDVLVRTMSSSVVDKYRRKFLRKRKKREFDRKQNKNGNGTQQAQSSSQTDEYIPLKKRRLDLKNKIISSQKSIRSAKEEQEHKLRQESIRKAMGGRDTRSLIDQHQELISKGINTHMYM